MPVKVFGSPYLATFVKNNAASFGITETIEDTLLVYARGGSLSTYGDNWISTAQPTSERTWARGFYPISKIAEPVASAATPDCIQDDNRFSGASGQFQGNPKYLEFGFPTLAGTSDFLPLESTISYVRFWTLARGWQTRTQGTLIGTGGGACPSYAGECCNDPNCWVTPRGYLNGDLGEGVLYPYITPVGHVNLAPTAESQAVVTSQKAGVPTFFRARDEHTSSLKQGFVLRWDLTDITYRTSENWKLNPSLSEAVYPSPGQQLADNIYWPNENYVMRTEAFTQNPFGASGIPWTADYAQWCAFGLKLSTGASCNCEGAMVSDFAIEIGYELNPFTVVTKCGEDQPTTDGALIKGYFESSSLPVDWRFEYGTNPANLTNATPWNLFVTGPLNVSHLLTGLAAGTYYYRLVIRDADLVLYYGDICSFETSANCQVRSILVM